MKPFFLSDEEHGKKYDDRKPSKIPGLRAPHWHPARLPPRRTLRRTLLLAIVVGLCVYVFVKNIPDDLPIRDRRRPVYADHGAPGSFRPQKPAVTLPQRQPKKNAHEPSSVSTALYSGPLKFTKLAKTLHGISEFTKGSFPINRNVLFAASNPRSAATLLPLACAMGREMRSLIHFALMGSTKITLQELRDINGLDDSCQIHYHDARPDYAQALSENRLATSISRALFHIQNFMHPQLVFVDVKDEDRFFLDSMRSEASSLPMSLFELPPESARRLRWLAKLDSAALAAWNRIFIDILIQVTPGASGSLIRLLGSLSAADFRACSVPHITIELPPDPDSSILRFLENFQWPPADVPNPNKVRLVSVRHRIPRTQMTEEESSARFLELFWPVNPKNSHVLVLSPQAELAPQFYHYLKYALAEYVYSKAARRQSSLSRLFGISLDLPSVYLNGSASFSPPTTQGTVRSAVKRGDGPMTFSWQAPNSNAVLFLGSKWIELHRFTSKLIAARSTLQPVPRLLSESLVSKRYPAWLDHALKLSRARGYWTLYPSQMTARKLATVHTDLWHPPEEHDAAGLMSDAPDSSEVVLAAGALPGSLPAFNDMPFLLWDGTPANPVQADEAKQKYANEFRSAVGGCENFLPRELAPHSSMRDLFCQRIPTNDDDE